MNCKICNELSSFEKINTYKHYWFFCKKCKNIYSENKKKKNSKLKIFFTNLLYRVTKQKRLKELLLYNQTDNSNVYRLQYEKILSNSEKVIPNKWDNYDDIFIDYLKRHEISLNSKKILSISDEPGLIVNKLKKFTSIENITLTALEYEIADLMSAKLNCKVKKFDLNKDKLSQIVNEKFDLIFFRSTLNFNYDFESLFREVDKISNKNAKIYLSIHTPTTASCLMWMFDDYTLLSLINLDFLKSIIKKYNFKILTTEKNLFNPRKHYYTTIFKKIFYYPFYYYYYFQIILKKIINNLQTKVSNEEIVYKIIIEKKE